MTGRPKPKWAEYELLAAKIIKELSPHAQVTHDEHIFGHESETRRQIDVVARWTDNDEDRVLIVQVKDYGRRANINVVGEFSSVIRDVHADRGVLICSGGFSKQAITYARNLGIDLYSLADANSKRWELELTIPVVWNRIAPDIRLNWKMHVKDAPFSLSLRENGSPPFVYSDTGDEYDFTDQFQTRWESGEISHGLNEEHSYTTSDKLSLEGVNAKGEKRFAELCEPNITYTVRRESYLGHLTPSEYRGLIDHLNDQHFLPSHLHIEVPSLESDSWVQISDPSRIAVDVADFFITVDDAHIDTAQFENFSMTYLGEFLSGHR